MPLSDYKDLFGKPNEGIHSYRFGGLAIVDVLLTVLLIFAIQPYMPTDLLTTCIIVIISFILIHKMFGVDTALNKMLGLY